MRWTVSLGLCARACQEEPKRALQGMPLALRDSTHLYPSRDLDLEGIGTERCAANQYTSLSLSLTQLLIH